MSGRLLRQLPAVLWATMFAILVVTVAMPVITGKGLEEIYADPVVVVFFVFVLTFVTVGALVASKRPANPIGWIMIAAGIAYSVGGLTISVLEDVMSRPLGASLASRYLVWLSSWVFAIGPLLSGTFLLLLFPNGRLPSPRWRQVARLAALGLVLFVVGVAFQPGELGGYEDVVNPVAIGDNADPFEVTSQIGLICFLISMTLAVVSLFVRYRTAGPKERTQLKWIAYAGAFVAVIAPITIAIEGVVQTEVATNISNFLMTGALSTLPIAIGIAMLRHRLFDIDRVINRTLVYALVTGSAVAVYAGTVFVVGAVVVGSSDNLTVAVATLAAAAVFRPALKWVQAFVDRRFYRHKYDAQHTIDAFGVRLREETDLDELTGDLVAVVRTTMQPETVSVWLTGSEKIAEASRLVAKTSSDVAESPPDR
jgi:hypothetical protein